MTEQSDILGHCSFLKSKFAEDNIKVCQDWLTGCVEWFMSEHETISRPLLFKKAMEQWLLADLREVGAGCLPDKAFQKREEIYLNGKFPVQMQSILNISESFYDQLRYIQKRQLDEAIDEREERQTVKKRRMFKLNLTDGKRDIVAMEYSTIVLLTSKLNPGLKLLLLGPIRCVNAVLFLESANVKILGGELDILLISNAYENLLLQGLGKPINPKPITNYVEPPAKEQSTTFTNQNQRTPAPSIVNNRNVSNLFDDDDLFKEINLNFIEQHELELNQSVSSADRLNNAGISENDLEILAAIDMEDEICFENQSVGISALTENRISSRVDTNVPKKCFSNFGSASMLYDTLIDSEEDVDDCLLVEPVVRRSITDTDYPYQICDTPLGTLDQIMKASNRRIAFVVFAEIDSIYEKLQITANAWKLGVILMDTMNVKQQARVSSKVLASLSGYDAQEMQAMRKQQSQRPQLREELSKIIFNLRNKMQEMRCFMKLRFIDDSDVPCVVELIKATADLSKILNSKMEQEEGIIPPQNEQ